MQIIRLIAPDLLLFSVIRLIAPDLLLFSEIRLIAPDLLLFSVIRLIAPDLLLFSVMQALRACNYGQNSSIITIADRYSKELGEVRIKTKKKTNLHASERIRQYIEAELERPDREVSRLPVVRDIAKHLKVSPGTINKTFKKLVEEGKIITRRGDGTFLVTPPTKPNVLKVSVMMHAYDIEGNGDSGKWEHEIVDAILHSVTRLPKPIAIMPLSFDTKIPNSFTDEQAQELRDADGVIMLRIFNSDVIRDTYLGADKPTVCVNAPHETCTRNFVSSNYYGAAAKLGHAWCKTGRNHVLFIETQDTKNHVFCHQNIQGLFSEFASYNSNERSFRVADAESAGEDAGYHAMLKILDDVQEPHPDCIYCSEDSLAHGVMNALEERGINVPQDTSVVGGTGLQLPDMVPPFTRVMQPLEALGNHALAMLMKRIETQKNIPGIFLPTPFGGGATTRPEENVLLGTSF